MFALHLYEKMERVKRTSLKDIASSIGVSATLVSFVLNGKAKQYNISEEMTQRVIAKAKEMKYSPNLVARNLREGKTQLIGIIVSDISNPFFSKMIRIIEKRAYELNYTVVFGSSDEDPNTIQRLVDMFLNKGVDGLIIVPCSGSAKIIDKIPLVLIDRYFQDLNVSFSCLNNAKATELATQHLIEQGLKDIALVVYNTEMSHNKERIAGYEMSMIQAGLKEHLHVQKISIVNPKLEVGKALDYLVRKEKIEGVVFSTNMLCVYGLHCFNEMNVKIPDEVAIVGFDGNDVFDLFYSPVSYINQPIDQISEEAVNLIVDIIDTGLPVDRTMLITEPDLVVRKSSLKRVLING